jgi:hypothetical protein
MCHIRPCVVKESITETTDLGWAKKARPAVTPKFLWTASAKVPRIYYEAKIVVRIKEPQMSLRSKISAIVLTASFLSLTACEIPLISKDDNAATAPSDGSDSSGGGASSGGTLSTSDLAGVWDTGHIAKENMEGRSNGACYREMLIVNGNTFQWSRAWYSSMTNGYCTGTALGDESAEGLLAVGQPISASSTNYSIEFTMGPSAVRTYETTSRSYINTACGINMTGSQPVSVTGNSCSATPEYIGFATNGASVNNIIRKSGNVIEIGAPATDLFIPGVLSGAFPASPSLTFIKR